MTLAVLISLPFHKNSRICSLIATKRLARILTWLHWVYRFRLQRIKELSYCFEHWFLSRPWRPGIRKGPNWETLQAREASVNREKGAGACAVHEKARWSWELRVLGVQLEKTQRRADSGSVTGDWIACSQMHFGPSVRDTDLKAGATFRHLIKARDLP